MGRFDYFPTIYYTQRDLWKNKKNLWYPPFKEQKMKLQIKHKTKIPLLQQSFLQQVLLPHETLPLRYETIPWGTIWTKWTMNMYVNNIFSTLIWQLLAIATNVKNNFLANETLWTIWKCTCMLILYFRHADFEISGKCNQCGK